MLDEFGNGNFHILKSHVSFLFFAGRIDSVLNNMDVDQLYPLCVQFLSYCFLSLGYGVNCLVMCIIVFNENVTKLLGT